MNTNEIMIFDTTLRDGEQSPGFAMTALEKLEMALVLDDLGVDIIEAGFPIASPGEFKAVENISRNVHHSIVCGFSRATTNDIDVTAKAIKPAIKKERGRINLFLPVSDIHLEHKMNISREEALLIIDKSIKQALKYTADVQFGLEDSSRADPMFIRQVSETIVKAGAKTLTLGDTVGYSTPDDIVKMVENVNNNVPNIDQIILSMHCHNDLGLAVANSLAALQAGVKQIEVTINGIGERAGNASLEEIAMAIHVRSDKFSCTYNLDTTKLMQASQTLSRITGINVPPNKAIVGDNAFGHSAGIHQAALLKNANTYQIMTPESVGQSHLKFTFTKHSGFAGFKSIIESNNIILDDKILEMAFDKAIVLADKQKTVIDDQLIAIVKGVEAEYTLQ